MKELESKIQEIIDHAVHTKQHDFFTEIPYEHFEWLIRQAEKVEKIEEEIRGKWSTEQVSVNRLHQLLNKD